MTTSSTTLPIDHAAEALRLITTRGRNAQEADERTTRAQVHATLALVEEQRTANLIALYGIAVSRGGQHEATVALERQVITRLGLGEPA